MARAPSSSAPSSIAMSKCSGKCEQALPSVTVARRRDGPGSRRRSRTTSPAPSRPPDRSPADRPQLRLGRQQPGDRVGRYGEAAQRGASLPGALGVVDQLGALDPDLVAEPPCSKTGVPKPPGRRLQRDLVVRLAGRSTIRTATRADAATVAVTARRERSRRGGSNQAATGSSGGGCAVHGRKLHRAVVDRAAPDRAHVDDVVLAQLPGLLRALLGKLVEGALDVAGGEVEQRLLGAPRGRPRAHSCGSRARPCG